MHAGVTRDANGWPAALVARQPLRADRNSHRA
jgi:hypothetical protein